MTPVELLSELGVDTRVKGEHHHATDGFVQIDCPHCSPNTGRFRMGVHRGTGRCVCYVCGSHPLAKTLHLATGAGYRDLFDRIGSLDRGGVEIASRVATGRKEAILPPTLEPLHGPYTTYLRDRWPDLSRTQIARLTRLWGLMATGPVGRWGWRVWIPAREDGRVVTWTARSISAVNPLRYYTCPAEKEAVNIKSVLLGSDLAEHVVVVCEGPMDAIRFGPGAVAIGGQKWGWEQFGRISRYPVRVVCFDSEPEAQSRAKRLYNELKPFPGRTMIARVDAPDLGSAKQKDVLALRKMTGLPRWW